jgi:hypothetical protein
MQFILKIKTGNAAMQTWFDIANALRTVSMQLPDSDVALSKDSGNIRDENGNTVGQWETK